MLIEILNMILPYVLYALGILVSGMATWLTTVVVKWFNSKIKNKEVAALMESILLITGDAVKATYQTYVEGLKGTNAWTKEAQEKALYETLNTIKATLSVDALAFLEARHGNLDEYLKTLIHSVLYDLKN